MALFLIGTRDKCLKYVYFHDLDSGQYTRCEGDLKMESAMGRP